MSSKISVKQTHETVRQFVTEDKLQTAFIEALISCNAGKYFPVTPKTAGEVLAPQLQSIIDRVGSNITQSESDLLERCLFKLVYVLETISSHQSALQFSIQEIVDQTFRLALIPATSKPKSIAVSSDKRSQKNPVGIPRNGTAVSSI